MFKKVVSFVLFLATATGFAGAADEATPGDLLYGFDRRLESVQTQLQRQPTSLEALNDRIIEERLLEAGHLIDIGSIDDALQLLAEINLGAPALPGDNFVIKNDALASEQTNSSYCTAPATARQPELVIFATALQTPYSELLEWYCAGFTANDINSSYKISIASNIPVDILFAQAQEGYTWEDIAQAAGLSSITELTQNSDATEAFCLPEGNPSTDKRHPEAMKLSEEIKVPYETIIHWFCTGFGFGDIRLAYAMSMQGGYEVKDLFALRTTGMEWGEIMQQLDLNGSTVNKPDQDTPTDSDPEKPEKTEKPKKTEKPPK